MDVQKHIPPEIKICGYRTTVLYTGQDRKPQRRPNRNKPPQQTFFSTAYEPKIETIEPAEQNIESPIPPREKQVETPTPQIETPAPTNIVTTETEQIQKTEPLTQKRTSDIEEMETEDELSINETIDESTPK